MSQNEKMYLSSQTLELAESESFLTLTNRVCYYDEPNLNGVKLPSENALERAQTLVNMPVVAAYQVNAEGLPDLKGHEVSIDPNTNEVKFGTENIGTHTDVEIRDEVVNIGGKTKILPCLFATLKIWKRNSNVCAAIKRLFAEGKLHNSWEIKSEAFTFENKVKTLTDYYFEANCLLGEYHSPAYGTTSKVLSLSELEPSVVISEAIQQDIALRINKEDEEMTEIITSTEVEAIEEASVTNASVEESTVTEGENIKMPIEEEIVESETEVTEIIDAPTEEVHEGSTVETIESEEVIEKISEEVEIASMTVEDLYRELTVACRKKIDAWCYVWYLFPAEQICWVRYDSKNELDYLKFNYTVNGDVVEVGEPESKTLIASVNTLEAKISELTESIITANDKIQELQATVEELVPYKEEKIRSEKEEAKAQLIKFAMKSKQISEAEINDVQSEVHRFIEDLNTAAIKEIIADRVVNSISTVECSTTRKDAHERASIYSDDMTAKSLVGLYINKK